MATLGNSGDVSTTLGELERKLRELEQELARVGHPSPAANEPLVPPVPTPITPAPPVPTAATSIAAVPPLTPDRDGAERLTVLEDQLDALRRYGEELQGSAERLLEAYRSALHEMERPRPPAPVAPPAPAPVSTPHAPDLVPPAPAPSAAVPVPPPAVPAATRAGPPAAPAPSEDAYVPPASTPQAEPGADWDPIAPGVPAARAPIGRGHEDQDAIIARLLAAQASGLQASGAPAPGPGGAPAPDLSDLGGVAVPPPPAAPVSTVHEAATHQSYVGPVTIDAGPFTDIASLSAFEQAIARTPGVRDVYVRGFQGQRVVIDVEVGVPTALVPELAALSPEPFIVNGADATGLVVTITSGSPHA